MNRAKIAVVILLGFCFAVTMSPKTAFSLNHAEALVAADLLASQPLLREYCAICGDLRWNSFSPVHVHIIENADGFGILIDGRYVNINDLYVWMDDNWVNMGRILGLKPTENPFVLPLDVRCP